MTSGRPTEYEQLSPDDAAHVDAVCDGFEQAWKTSQATGEPPRIAKYPDGWGEPERTILARELGALDRACRERFGVPVQPEGYEKLIAEIEAPRHPGPPGATRPSALASCPSNWPRLPEFELLEILGVGGM